MKCDYCNAEDHLITACGARKGYQTLEGGGGCLVAAVLAPFWIAGAIVGAIGGAFTAGFHMFRGSWAYGLGKISSKKADENVPLL